MTDYAAHLQPSSQAESAPTDQVQNHAGGFVFTVDDWARLDRFLVLGAEGGTYYVGERKLTRENAACVERLLAVDGPRVVQRIMEISVSGRAPKNDPAIFALALALTACSPSRAGDLATRHAAQTAVNQVCRIGTHLFQLVAALKALGSGWNRGLRRAIRGWYQEKEPSALAPQLIKYQQRGGWAHRDLLRLTHPVASKGMGGGGEEQRNALYHYATQGWPDIGPEPHPDAVLVLLWAFERAKTADKAETIRLIRDHQLPWECVRSELLNEPEVWEALLPHMGLTALIRNLGKMTSIGLIAPLSEASKTIAGRLTNPEALRRARVHPLALLTALKTYTQGHGVKGRLTWNPDAQVIGALDRGFYAAFQNVEPTGKRWLLALDVSGSMEGGDIAGLPGVTPRVGSCAMAMVTAAVEAQHHIVGFTSGATGEWDSGSGNARGRPTMGLLPLTFSPLERLDALCKKIAKLPMGGTDCALPMIYARAQKIPVDVFVVYTDNETWAGNVHPFQALRDYRQAMGIPAKLIVVGMTATEFTIADPRDRGMLDVVGFDAAAPALMASFAREV